MTYLKEIFNILNKSYGPQGWWPLSKGNLETKHHNGSPEDEKDRFEIIIGAILTQNTAWNNVEKAIYNLNKENLIEPKKMAAEIESKIGELIRPAGYFNQKAKRLKFIAQYYLKNPEFLNKEKEVLRKELLAINGIGPETADSIILYAAEKPSFVIDAYTRRIFLRIFEKDFGNYDSWKEFFEKNLEKDTKLFNEYHALIVEHAKRYCNKAPKCEKCMLRKSCSYYNSRSSKL